MSSAVRAHRHRDDLRRQVLRRRARRVPPRGRRGGRTASSSPTRARSASSSLDGDQLWLVRQPREAIGVPDLLEIPAGKLDEEGEDPLETAKRELAEEIGKQAAHWESLGSFFTSPGFTTRRSTSSSPRASRTSTSAPRSRRTSASTSRSARCRDLDAILAENQDSKTLVALYRLKDRLARLSGRQRACAHGPVAPEGRQRADAEGMTDGRRRRSPSRARIRRTVRAPRARLPRLPRVRARALAQHARGLPLRPAAVRRAT